MDTASMLKDRVAEILSENGIDFDTIEVVPPIEQEFIESIDRRSFVFRAYIKKCESFTMASFDISMNSEGVWDKLPPLYRVKPASVLS